MNWWPMHSWHPVVVHLPLVGLAAAITTGLLAYNRVEHSDPAHVEMTLHRNLALAAVAVLLATALWRWRRPYSRGAALLGIIGAGILGGVGYLGGELVYRHALGIPTQTLEETAQERGGNVKEHSEESTQPDTTMRHQH